MTPRLFLDAPLARGKAVILGIEQTHYLKSVLRRKAGDAVLVFNGRDGEFSGAILSINKNAIHIELKDQTREAKPEPEISLYFAPVKRAAVEAVIQKGVELGVTAFFPAITQRTQHERLKLDRLRAIGVEAAEQSGRLTAPAIHAPQPLTEILNQWRDGVRLVYCDESGNDPEKTWGGEQGRAQPALAVFNALAETKDDWAIIIGPEGGFSPDERQLLRSKDFVSPVSLGPRILRADTAAIAALTLWQAVLGDWRAM